VPSQKIDLLVIVALPEEADYLERAGFYALKSGGRLQKFPYSTFEFLDNERRSRKAVLVQVGEVGDRARDVTAIFCPYFAPSLVVNLGISGRVGDDAKVGDVVIPTQLNQYDFQAAIVDENSEYKLLPGGRSAPLDQGIRFHAISNEFKRGLKLPTLRAFCASADIALSQTDTGKCDVWQSEGKLSANPTIVNGPFAVGVSVAKSQQFSHEVLRKTNRNVLAVDMESVLIASALESLEKMPKYYSIRAISDPGTAEKKQFDAVGRGAIRFWAMSNIAIVFKQLIEHAPIFGRAGAAAKQTPARDSVTSHRARNWIGDFPGQNVLESSQIDWLNKRFCNIRRVSPKPDSSSFENLLDEIISGGPGKNYLVQGHGGCGKTAILIALASKIERRNDGSVALINLRDLRGELEGNRVGDAGNYFSTRYAEQLRPGRRLFLLLDELHGDPSETEIVKAILAELAPVEPTVVLAFGIDHFRAHRRGFESSASSIVRDLEYEAEYDLKNLRLADTSRVGDLVTGMIKTSTTKYDPAIEGLIVEGLTRLGFSYVNHFVISIYLHNYRKPSFRDKQNSTDFILKAMKDLYERSKPSMKAVSFEAMCVEALRVHSTGLRGARNGAPDLNVRRLYDDLYGRFPKVVQTALIANAILHLLTASSDDEAFSQHNIDADSFYRMVFGNDVNACIKDLLSDETTELQILRSATAILDAVEIPRLSFALYLLGRARSQRGSQIAREALHKATTLLTNALATPLKTQSASSLTEDQKFEMLAVRTLFISKSIFNDEEATDTYITRVLENPLEDDLNRSFHLEYYGDQASGGMDIQLNLEDQGKEWKRTKEVLGARIESALAKRTFSNFDRICVLTYFCFVKTRHESFSLAANERKEYQNLIGRLRKSSFNMGDTLVSFLDMLERNLERSTFNYIDAILELYALKDIPRAGWVAEHRDFNPGGGTVETVAAHTLGAIFLAQLLCRQIKGFPADAENNVIAMLITHDFGEAYIGDYIPTDGVAKAKEPAAVARIESLSTYKHLSSLRGVASRFREFEAGSSQVAAVAKQLDKLDAIFQATVYAKRFKDKEDRRSFFEYHLDLIRTAELRAIAVEVTERAMSIPLDGEIEGAST
jgi:5'-deoxynucleotidase YfbR-like HD superfamily hydrolase/nucleoside phosphorylase